MFKKPKLLPLAKIQTINKIILWRPCVFSYFYIFISSDLLPFFHIYVRVRVCVHPRMRVRVKEREREREREREYCSFSVPLIELVY